MNAFPEASNGADWQGPVCIYHAPPPTTITTAFTITTYHNPTSRRSSRTTVVEVDPSDEDEKISDEPTRLPEVKGTGRHPDSVMFQPQPDSTSGSTIIAEELPRRGQPHRALRRSGNRRSQPVQPSTEVSQYYQLSSGECRGSVPQGSAPRAHHCSGQRNPSV